MSKLVRMPELTELRTFCAAVDLGSIGRAARLLRVSQPALSKRLQGLEALTGSRLLERSTRGVSPTPAGKQLSIANSRAVRTLVLEGRADIGIAAVSGPDPKAARLCETPFCEDEIVVAVPEAHPWAAVEEIDPAEFVTTRMIMRDPGADSRRAVSEEIEALGMSLAPPLTEIGSTAAATTTAVSEGAPALLSSLAVPLSGKPGLVVRRVAGLRFPRRFVLLHSGEESSLPAPARSLARDLLETRLRS